MRIAVVAHDYPTPGSNAGAFVQARVDLYRRMGHEVDVFSRQNRAAWRPHYDVIQVHYPLPEFNIPLVQRNRNASPVIAFLHGAEAIATPDKPLFWGIRAKVAVKRFLRTCDAVVTVSEWMRAQVEAYLGVSPLVIPNPVDPDLFAFRDGGRLPWALCLRGRLPKYGTDILGSAIRQDHLPPVHILDPVFARTELPEVLRHYEVFVAPSRLEGHGLLACEAAASGMKVVTTRVGGIPEFFSDGDAMFADLTPNSIENAVEDAFKWRPDRLAIRRRVLERCGPEVTVDRDIRLMSEAVVKREMSWYE